MVQKFWHLLSKSWTKTNTAELGPSKETHRKLETVPAPKWTLCDWKAVAAFH